MLLLENKSLQIDDPASSSRLCSHVHGSHHAGGWRGPYWWPCHQHLVYVRSRLCSHTGHITQVVAEDQIKEPRINMQKIYDLNMQPWRDNSGGNSPELLSQLGKVKPSHWSEGHRWFDSTHAATTQHKSSKLWYSRWARDDAQIFDTRVPSMGSVYLKMDSHICTGWHIDSADAKFFHKTEPSYRSSVFVAIASRDGDIAYFYIE